jgi:hypothetical protein
MKYYHVSWWHISFSLTFHLTQNMAAYPDFKGFFLNIIELETGVMTDILVLTRAADHGAQHWDFSSERVSRFSSEK